MALSIIKDAGDMDLQISELDIKFTRRQHDNLLTKAQSLTTMLEAGLKPEIAIATCGLFNDPMDVALQSKDYLSAKWKTEQQMQEQMNQQIQNTQLPQQGAVTKDE